MTNVIDIAKKCFQDEAQAIMDLIPKLDGNFTKAIELIIGSKGMALGLLPLPEPTFPPCTPGTHCLE